jgi:hypothetical protein
MATPLGPITRMVQEQPMLDASITAIHPAGFTIQIHLHNKGYDELDATIDALEQLGYRPSRSGDGWERTPEGLPICPKHRVPMRQRLKQGDELFSHGITNRTTGELVYCKGYKSPSSTGFDLAGEGDAHP